MQVRTPSLQHEVMIEAVENHMPQVIVIDEIGTELEAQAARTIAERGVQLIGTAHGNNLDNLMLNPTLSDLIGGIQSVTLGDEEARRRRTQKSVLERKAPPTFDVIIEIQDRERVTVHADVAETVDSMLRGDSVAPELRWRDEEGVHRIARPGRGRRRASSSAPSGSRVSSGPGSRGGWSPAGGATAATAGRRLSRRGGGRRPRRRRRGVPLRLSAGSERRLAPDPRRLGPRARAARRPQSEGGAAGVIPGERFAQPAEPAAGPGRLDDPPFVSGEIADRGPLERGAPSVRRHAGPRRARAASARRPGATRRAGRSPRSRPRRGPAPVNADDLDDDDDAPAPDRDRGGRARRGASSSRAARRCRRSASCPRGSAGSGSRRRSATSSCRSTSPATSTRRTS